MAAQRLDSALGARLQSAIEIQRARWSQKGISAAVIIPGLGIWSGSDGESYTGVPMNSSMRLGAGSVTKTFTSALILQLAEEGKLSLGDSLHRWLPGYANIDSTITIRQLLNHTSGIYNYTTNQKWGDSVFNDPARIWKPEEIVGYFTGDRSFAPGKGWEYSNTGYILLGMIAEKASGSKLVTEFRNRFLNRFELRSTTLEPDEEITGELAHPWSDFDGDDEPEDVFLFPRQGVYSSAWGAGAMISTPADLAAWASALYGGRVLHDSSMTRLLTFRSLGGGTGYGLGVSRFPVAGKTVYGHGGNIIGYSTSMLYYPEKGIAVAVMVNGEMQADAIGSTLMAEAMNLATSGVNFSSGNAGAGISLGDVRVERSGSAVRAEYSLAEPGITTVTLHDMLGREIARTTEEREAGFHAATLRTDGLPHGTYICRLQAGGRVATRKIAF